MPQENGEVRSLGNSGQSLSKLNANANKGQEVRARGLAQRSEGLRTGTVSIGNGRQLKGVGTSTPDTCMLTSVC